MQHIYINKKQTIIYKMDFSKITDEELMWEAKKRFAIPIYYNKQEAEKKIREKDDTFKGMSDDEWDNFKDDFNTGDSDQVQFDNILDFMIGHPYARYAMTSVWIMTTSSATDATINPWVATSAGVRVLLKNQKRKRSVSV